ncbi:protein transport protein SEC16B homolog [Malus sylvestris]|uniref:protein transport protein SEC16B homolog n=1 Tax=Malus sylvestris TaxID=3752 RepID=UPI0021ABAA23|nr:protein transport protein SEC16B homolog [Malus sylvestris]
MASNHPPFQVEDLTDEDFFDKLVEDDLRPSESGPEYGQGNDSDDGKAFANLSIGSSVAVSEDSDHETKTTDENKRFVNPNVGDSAAVSEDSAAKPQTKEEKGAEESNSFVFDSVIESNNAVDNDAVIESNNGAEAVRSQLRLDSTVSKGNESGASGVKEIGWGSFYADSADNGIHGFGSYSDFFSELGDGSGDFPMKVDGSLSTESKTVLNNEDQTAHQEGLNHLVSNEKCQEGQVYGGSEQDQNSTEYWESLYPGWKYDANMGQWYQVDSFDVPANAQGSVGTDDWTTVSDGNKTEVSYFQQTAQSAAGTVTETSTTGSLSNWDQVSQMTNGYPKHMVFNPEYPGWYYDTIAQEWRSLEAYSSSVQSTAQSQNGNSMYGQEYRQDDNYGPQAVVGNQGQDSKWVGSYSKYNQHASNMWQAQTAAKSEGFSGFSGNQKQSNSFGSTVNTDQYMSLNSFGAVPLYNKASQGHGSAKETVGFQSFIPAGNFSQQFNQGNAKMSEQIQFSDDYYGAQKPLSYSQQPVNYSQPPFQSGNQFSYAPSVGRSSAGRPPHALVTFGFGGKLILMKDNSSLRNPSYGTQDPVGGSVSVLNLMEVFTGKTDPSSFGMSTCDYFRALCQQSFPGPLVGGSVGSKELNKWIDERIANCESPEMDYRKGKVLRLLLSLLRIACQHYGKLRYPFGTDTVSRENDTPESAVAKLFASAKSNNVQFSYYGSVSHCVQKTPSEGQLRATASEVQNLLVSGRKKEGLQCAQEGQLWGPALVIASQLGEQFYVDTVKQMALRQLVAGSPLRTLCLLIAGQPAEVFSADTTAEVNLPGAANTSQQPAQFGANKMLDDWEENLAVITANRTKDDELVIIHLGDCLWKDRSEITAAHICYLVAEANFESYSDSARLCLIGADHWKSPRTYANPEAIQRTELYEYSRVLGNSQFILLPFQPYKLIYAHMLAEVGRVSDSLKYCQTILKSLKTGRAPEVETWKQLVLSLEERIKTHQQGGYSVNLVSTKFVGKLLNLFDSTAHRVVGGLPPPAPSTSQGSAHGNGHYQQPMGPRVSSSQSTMAMSSLIPSASMEPISDWTSDGNRKPMHNRSVSEPDFGRTPRQVDSSKQTASPDAQGKSSGGSRFSRFGFGSQLLQKTVGLVLRPRPGKQAKLGETNKFYYDEKLKRWVEEGVEPLAEDTVLPPPPICTPFQNGVSDYNLRSVLKKEGSPTKGSPDLQTSTPPGPTSGTPPIPPSSNQFSSRGRLGIRSRYVDTFNQGGGSPVNSFESPAVPSVKPLVAANAKFFIPTVAPSNEQAMEAIAESVQEDGGATNENPSTFGNNDSFHTPPPSSSSSNTMQRYPSMGNIQSMGVATTSNDSAPPHSRRTASWGGSSNDVLSPPMETGEIKPLGEALGMSPAMFRPSELSRTRTPMNGGSFGDDLHEVEL